MTEPVLKHKTDSNIGFTLDNREFVGKITKNLKSDIIYTNKDKLTLALKDYEENIKLKYSVAASLGTVLSLLLTILTAEKFKDFLGLSAEEWKAIVLVALFLSIVHLVYKLICIALKKKELNIEFTISKIMKGENAE